MLKKSLDSDFERLDLNPVLQRAGLGGCVIAVCCLNMARHTKYYCFTNCIGRHDLFPCYGCESFSDGTFYRERN